MKHITVYQLQMKQLKQQLNYQIVIFQIVFLPDKAIDLIDEAGSKVRFRSYTTPPNLKELEVKLEEVRKKKMLLFKVKNLKKLHHYEILNNVFVKN